MGFRKAEKPTEGGVRVSTNVDLSRPHIKYPNLDGRGFGSIKFLSTPMAVDVSAEGMKKKNLPKGTGVTYSGIRTSSQGLLTGAKTEKKTLLGG
jgi:hypothetical protein